MASVQESIDVDAPVATAVDDALREDAIGQAVGERRPQ
jgi:hypothetical protein